MSGIILRESLPDESAPGYVEMYLGNGRFGAVLDAFGFMNAPRRNLPDLVVQVEDEGWVGAQGPPATVFMHVDHWAEGAYGMQGLIPPARLLLVGGPSHPEMYRQVHDIYRGSLVTEMRFDGVRWKTAAFFNPEARDVFAVQLDYSASDEGRLPAIRLEAITATASFYGSVFAGTLQSEQAAIDSGWVGKLRMAEADTVLSLQVACREGRACLTPSGYGVTVDLHGSSGSMLILVGIAARARVQEMAADMSRAASANDWAEECAQAWRRRRGEARLSIPDPGIQALFDRSVYAMLCSLSPDVCSPATACGLTAFCWGWAGFFPQDFSYVLPALLSLGFIDIARAKIEFFNRCIPSATECTRRIYGVEGVMWPWEHPVTPRFSILRGSSPNWYQFEIHNSAYPARMAFETSVFARDPAWSREIAWPVVRESARFFASIARREADSGKWSIFVTPSMGQDEFGGVNDSNFLCALFAAQYCLETGLKMAAMLDQEQPGELDLWRQILQEGLSYDRVFDEHPGMYRTHEHLSPDEGMHRQKIPVQLNPLVFLPLSTGIDEPLRRAYAERRELCAGVKQGEPQGWTLPAFLLAAARMGDAEGVLRELEEMIRSHNIDPSFIQIYEDAIHGIGKYYITSQGLFMQAMIDAMVSDCWGELSIGAACPTAWKGASFTGIHLAGGKVLSGRRDGAGWVLDGAPPSPAPRGGYGPRRIEQPRPGGRAQCGSVSSSPGRKS